MRSVPCENQGYQAYRQAGWRGVVNREYAKLLCDLENPDAMLMAPANLAQSRRASTIYVMELAGRKVFVKHMTRLKNPKYFLREIEERLKWLLRPSRAVRSWQMSERVTAAGVGSYHVVLAARRRRGLFHAEDMLVSEAVPGEPFNEVLARRDVMGIHQAHLRAMGHDIARLHNAGVLPGDLAPLNIFLHDEAGITLIDHDRTQHWPRYAPKYLRFRNLVPLLYRVKLYTNWQAMKVILDCYLETANLGKGRRAARYRIIQLCRRRITQYHQRPNPNTYIQRMQEAVQAE